MTEVEPEGFDEFWSVYPRRVAKLAAIRMYRRAVKKTAPATVIAAARRYADERIGQDPAFTKHPATWLNGGCWDDEATPRRSVGVIGALDRLEQYLSAVDDHEGRADDLLGLPPRRLC